MSKPFNGAPEGPAPAQGHNLHVHERPEPHAEPTRPRPGITKNAADYRDDQSTPSRIEEGAVENPRGKTYRGHSEHLSHNDEGFSGHPHLSDGSVRYDSQLSSPLATPSKSGPTKAVNATDIDPVKKK